jgi:hypothetical protein
MGLFVACAASDNTIGQPDSGGGGPGPDATPNTDGPGASDSTQNHDTGSSTLDQSSAPDGCTGAHCTTGADCDNACGPAPAGDHNCCDYATSMCFRSMQTCSPPVPEGGGMPDSPI